MLETIIRNATQMWCADPIHLRNPLQFLQLCSHCVIDSYVENALLRISSQQNSQPTTSSRPVDENPTGLWPMTLKPSTPRKNKSNQITRDTRKCTATDPPSYIQALEDLQCDMPEVVNTESNKRLDPPPLAFYPKQMNGKVQRPIIISATQPPPLVPIERTFKR